MPLSNPTTPERDLLAVTYDKVKEIRVVDTDDQSKVLAIENLAIAGTKVTVAVEGIDATDVNGALAEHQADIETLGTEKVSTTTEVIAGAGLTGGGTLGTSRTLNVAATNDSVVVADDGIKVNTYNGLDSTSTTRPLSAAQGRALDGAKVGLTGNETVAGIKTFSSSPVVPTPTTDYQAATKAYADSLVVGLLDYRGGFDASVNAYPSSGGSGAAGAILKGDMWVVSVGGTIDGKVIHAGDSLIANVDAPGQTTAKWNTVNSNLTYVPENVANKKVDLTSESDTFYPSVGAVTRGMAAERASIIESLTLQIDGGTAFSVYGGAGVIDGGVSTTF